MSAEATVTVSCGNIDSTYRGVADPQLEAVYLQTEAERERYEPIMEYFLENGLDSEGTTISGI